jgi:hypothetical protein
VEEKAAPREFRNRQLSPKVDTAIQPVGIKKYWTLEENVQGPTKKNSVA